MGHRGDVTWGHGLAGQLYPRARRHLQSPLLLPGQLGQANSARLSSHCTIMPTTPHLAAPTLKPLLWLLPPTFLGPPKSSLSFHAASSRKSSTDTST